jgi:hypothetical protein
MGILHLEPLLEALARRFPDIAPVTAVHDPSAGGFLLRAGERTSRIGYLEAERRDYERAFSELARE